MRRVAARLLYSLDSDEIDDVIGTFYVVMLVNDMRRLRLWAVGARGASLASWLALIARKTAHRYFSRARRRDWAEAMRGDDRVRADNVPNRGGAWLRVAENVTNDAAKPTRKRKERDSDIIVDMKECFIGDAPSEQHHSAASLSEADAYRKARSHVSPGAQQGARLPVAA